MSDKGKQPAQQTAPMDVDSDDDDSRMAAVQALVSMGAPAPSQALPPDELRDRLAHFYEGRSLMGYDVSNKDPAKIAAKSRYHTKAAQDKLFADLERK